MAETLPVGESASEAERRVIRALRDALPADYTLFHTFELPGGARTYDFALLVMAPHAYYVVEVRPEDGLIQGDALQWWSNGRYIDSPLDALERRRKIVESLVDRYEYKFGQSAALPVVGLMALASERAEAKLSDPRAESTVVPLAQLAGVIMDASRVPSGRVKTLGKRAKLVRNWLRERLSPAKPVTSIGFYSVLAPLAETEQYRGYLAKHQFVGTEAEVKLKVYNADPYADAREKEELTKELFRDVTASRALGEHPGILNATDVFSWQDDRFAVVSRWRHGRYLAGLLNEPAFGPRQRVAAAADVAEAVSYAAEHGVLHRDISPVNVLVEPAGNAWLMNFSLARVEHPAVTTIVTALPPVSPYQAPEIIADGLHAASARSDLYSVGVMLHFMLTGEYPSFGVNGVLSYGQWRPRPARGRTSVDIERVLQRLCAQEPAQRYTEVRQAAADLRALSEAWG